MALVDPLSSSSPCSRSRTTSPPGASRSSRSGSSPATCSSLSSTRTAAGGRRSSSSRRRARLPSLRGRGLLPAGRRGLAADALHLDVHARGLGPLARQHALPLDLREQRRGHARPRPLPRLLRPRRPRGDRGADVRHAHLRDAAGRGDPEPRRERGDLGRAGRLLRPRPAQQGADARAARSSSSRSRPGCSSASTSSTRRSSAGSPSCSRRAEAASPTSRTSAGSLFGLLTAKLFATGRPRPLRPTY